MAIEVNAVSRRFGEVRALDEVSMTFGEGRIYGLLGNNGAGKTTLLNILTDRLSPTAGRVLIDGEPADRDGALGKLFFMSEGNLFPEDMRVRTAFRWAARFYPGFGEAEARALSEQFGLNTKSKINKLSTGYGSIFRLVLALAANTPYVLLDEPVLGLDAQHRELFYRLLLEKYAANRCTVVLSTHLISEAANLIEHVVVVRKGRVLKDAPVEDLAAEAFTVSGPAGIVDRYLEGRQVLGVTSLGGLKTAALQGEAGEIPEGLERSGMNLQDYFVALMEKEDRQ